MLKRLHALVFQASPSRRGVSIVIVSTLAAYVVTLVTLPLLTRLYGPDSYGAFTLVVALAGVVVPAATLRLESAAMLPRDRQDVIPLSSVAILNSIVVATLYALGVHVWIRVGQPPETVRSDTALWVFVMVLLGALFQLFTQLALRTKSYQEIASRNIFRAVGTSAAQLSLSLVTRAGWGLNLGSAIGSAIGLCTLYKRSRPFLGLVPPRQMAEALRRYWKFPLVFTPSSFLNALGLQLPLLFVAATFGGVATGHVGAAERVIAIPITLIGTAVGQVVVAEFAEKIRAESGGYLRPFLRASAMLGGAAVLVGTVTFFVAPWLIPAYLGPEWMQAGVYAQIIAVTTSIRIVTSPLSPIMVLFERASATLSLDVLRVALIGCGVAICLHFDLVISQALWVLYGALGLTHAVTWMYLYLLLKREEATFNAL